MTVEKYKVSYQGKKIWQGMALSENDAKAFARLEAKLEDLPQDIPLEELTTKVIPFDPAVDSPVPEKKGRKFRSDKDGTHKKKETKKRRTNYYLVVGEVQTFNSKDALDAALTKNEALAASMVIIGGTLRSVECQKKWILK